MKLLALLLALLFLAPAARAADDGEAQAFRAEMVQRINAFRHEEGLPAVRSSPDLDGIALAWARYLTPQGKLVHRSRDDMVRQMSGHGWDAFNENLFMASRDATPEAIVAAWKGSPGHRRNLLDPDITWIGIGRARTWGGAVYVVFNGAGGNRD
jgi:uncharacterized protein YkwD